MVSASCAVNLEHAAHATTILTCNGKVDMGFLMTAVTCRLESAVYVKGRGAMVNAYAAMVNVCAVTCRLRVGCLHEGMGSPGECVCACSEL